MKRKYKFCPFCKGKLVSRKSENVKRPVCGKCGWINYENPLPVVACVARNKEGDIVIIKRNITPGFNKWALPGGFIDKGEDPGYACLRELREETGLKGSIKRLIGAYLRISPVYGALIVLAYEVSVNIGAIICSDEVKEAGFFKKKALPKIGFSIHRKIIKDCMGGIHG